MSDVRETLQKTLGDSYRIERELGGGGMSRVFAARDERLGRDVVVKVLSPELAATISADRFERELKLAATLQHPHIVPVLSAGEAGALPYFIMPLVPGRSLRDRINEGPVPRGEAIKILTDVATALEYAHARDVVHRDIKPENILLHGRTAVVADFGIAKAIEASKTGAGAGLTTAGTSLGTPAYMAPEQVTGDAADHRADIYAWGLVAYELLTGRHPFAGKKTGQQLMAAHVVEKAPFDQRLGQLATVVMSCLEKDPHSRPHSAAELMEALGSHSVVTPLARPDEAPSIAVLPFANISNDPENDYLSDGITEEIIGALGRLGNLRVAARASSFAFKGKDVEVRTVGERLGVTSVVEGTVRKSGNRIRVSAELVDTTNGFQLWADRFERELTDAFALQDEIATAIANALQAKLVTPAGKTPATQVIVHPEAYELYLKGRHILHTQLLSGGIPKAIDHLERALALDPGFARAHAAFAEALLLAAVYLVREAHDAMPAARAAAERALALDPLLAEAYGTLGYIAYTYDWDRETARRQFDHSLALGPNEAITHARVAFLAADQGDIASVHAHVARAIELDPLSPGIRYRAGAVLSYIREFDAAISQLRETVELAPHYAEAYRWLGVVYAHAGRRDEAVVATQRAVTLSNRHPWAVCGLIREHFRAGEHAKANAVLAELHQRSAEELVTPIVFAFAYLFLNRLDEAMDWFEKAADNRDFWIFTAGRDPQYDPMRGNPRFEALVQRIASGNHTAPGGGKAQEIAAATAAVAQPVRLAAAPARLRLRSTLAAAALGALLIAAVILAWIFWPGETTASQSRLVVLPFDNLGQAGDEYFADGLAEELTNRLTRVPGIIVVARGSGALLKRQGRTAEQIGRQLKADYVLDGTVRWARVAGDSNLVRVTPALISASGEQIWGEPYQGVIAQVFQLQADIAERVAQALNARLGTRDIANVRAPSTDNVAAFDAYLAGRYEWKRRTPESLFAAIAHFERAIALDPNFARAHGGLGDSYAVLPAYTDSIPELEAYARADRALRRALALDPDLAEARAGLGQVLFYTHNWAGSYRALSRALELDPGYATAHQWMGELLVALGRTGEAVDAARRATVLEPAMAVTAWTHGFALYLDRREREAEQEMFRALRLNPAARIPKNQLAILYLQTGRPAEAVEQFVELGVPRELARAFAYLRTRADTAAAVRFAALSPNDFARGAAFARIGMVDSAFAALDRALDSKDNLVVWLKVDRDVGRLRADVRYTRLLERAGLTDAQLRTAGLLQ
jgi:TolB-like protein/Tfp pilus assembly protein PilF/tRNA A-37 threonylcarbamoyl transferase component Bud32